MTQEQMKEQAIDYIESNLNNKEALEVMKRILDGITAELYYEGYISISNTLTTAALIINEIIKED